MHFVSGVVVMAYPESGDSFDAMRAALKAYNPLPPFNRRPPQYSHYLAKKLNVTLPKTDLDLWLELAAARGRHLFVDTYHGYEPTSEDERQQVELALNELCAETGYKAEFYKGVTSGLYIVQIKRHKYTNMSKQRAALRRELAAARLLSESADDIAEPTTV